LAKRVAIFLVFQISVAINLLQSQSFPDVKKGMVEAGLNLSLSSINLYRNDFIRPHLGYGARITYHFNQTFAIMGEYSIAKPFDAKPTWQNIKSSNGGANFLIYGDVINQETEIYILMGLNYHYLSGFFTGSGDNYGLTNFFEPKTRVREERIGVNIGFGIQRSINRVTFFADFRYRFSTTELGTGINDVGYYAGFSYKLFKMKKRLRGIYKNVIKTNE
jgi:hypothetical protein